ncbi:MAG TPA: D-Ala-D-Ala carboxypeptidase family metallohydrolase [Oculatellaceae cyanobacterium]|jgi:uncharacterized protein YcbK (DUF882 family)
MSNELRAIQLTPNFSLGEFLHGEDVPAPWILDNLYRLANRLQVIRDLLGKPIIINSGYRSPQHNQAVGGSQNSFHMKGMAADIVVPGMAAPAVQRFLENWSGGLGCYTHFTHVDIRPQRARWKG